jgi:two-component sensor histidine kinase
VEAVRVPLLVLDQNLRVLAANRSFYSIFQANLRDTEAKIFFALGDGQWDIPELRLLLGEVASGRAVLDGYEVEHESAGLERRIILNARAISSGVNSPMNILLEIEDITERRAGERQLQQLIDRKDLLLEEVQHRIANSLQLIASILLLKARAVGSAETRLHLEDAHKRVVSVAALQRHLEQTGLGNEVDVGPFLSKLCRTLADSMIGKTQTVLLEVLADGGCTSSSEAVSLGLIVTESVINALKHAFHARESQGHILVDYHATGADWTLSISDDGIGKPGPGEYAQTKGGLGTSIINALAEQLEARVDVLSSPLGTTVSVTHTSSPSVPA